MPGLGPGDRRCKSCHGDHFLDLRFQIEHLRTLDERPSKGPRCFNRESQVVNCLAQWDKSSPSAC